MNGKVTKRGRESEDLPELRNSASCVDALVGLDLEDKKGKSPSRFFRLGVFFAHRPRQKNVKAFLNA